MAAHLLLVEDDDDFRTALSELLEEVGYRIDAAASLAEAESALARGRFDLVVCDVRGVSATDTPLAELELLQSRSPRVPMGVLTAWPAEREELERRGFAFLLKKPLGGEELLETISEHVDAPPVDAGQEERVRQYFAALERRDWHRLGALCHEDVVYHLPGQSALFSREIRGREAFLAFSAETFAAFPETRFEVTRLVPLPRGALAKFDSSWASPGGDRERTRGAVLFRFHDDLIATIGVRLDLQQLCATQTAHALASTPSPT